MTEKSIFLGRRGGGGGGAGEKSQILGGGGGNNALYPLGNDTKIMRNKMC